MCSATRLPTGMALFRVISTLMQPSQHRRTLGGKATPTARATLPTVPLVSLVGGPPWRIHIGPISHYLTQLNVLSIANKPGRSASQSDALE